MKMIRFRPDCREWIKKGLKTTTFRRTKKQGIYEIVEGLWYHPKHLGIIIKLTPINKTTANKVILYDYRTEGNFNSPEEFIEWLKKNKLELPETGLFIYLHEMVLFFV